MKYLLLLFVLFLSTFIYTQETDCNALDGHFEIGDTWTYENKYYYSESWFEFSATEVTITDTTSYEGNTVYIVNGNNRFYINEGKMYFWDDMLETYNMYFDFTSTDDYYIKFACDRNDHPDGLDSVHVSVDSVYYTIVDDNHVKTRSVTLSDPDGDWSWIDFIIYDNLGATIVPLGDFYNGIINGCSLADDFRNQLVDLRCFKSSSCDINFKDYPCDSTYTVTGVEDLILNGVVDIYPNPTSGVVHIDFEQSLSGQLSVFSLEGQEVYGQELENSTHAFLDLSQLISGLYMINIRSESETLTRKVVIK